MQDTHGAITPLSLGSPGISACPKRAHIEVETGSVSSSWGLRGGQAVLLDPPGVAAPTEEQQQ